MNMRNGLFIIIHTWTYDSIAITEMKYTCGCLDDQSGGRLSDTPIQARQVKTLRRNMARAFWQNAWRTCAGGPAGKGERSPCGRGMICIIPGRQSNMFAWKIRVKLQASSGFSWFIITFPNSLYTDARNASKHPNAPNVYATLVVWQCLPLISPIKCFSTINQVFQVWRGWGHRWS